MKLFIDESLSPSLATDLNASGDHDALHPLHRGLRGQKDHQVFELCLREDRVLVTENIVDFRKLAGRSVAHPGIIALPNVERARSMRLLKAGLAHLAAKQDPHDFMINKLMTVEESRRVTVTDLP